MWAAVGIIVGNTLAGAALLACIFAALLAVLLMRRRSRHDELMARNPEGSISPRKAAQGDQQDGFAATNAAGVPITANATSPEDVRLLGMS